MRVTSLDLNVRCPGGGGGRSVTLWAAADTGTEGQQTAVECVRGRIVFVTGPATIRVAFPAARRCARVRQGKALAQGGHCGRPST